MTLDFHPAHPPDQPLAYRVTGNDGARVVLLVHGWVSSGRMWADVMAALAPHFHCYAPDLPGCGDSPLPPGITPTLADYRAALRAFCAAQGIQPYAVIGHSLGALLALSLTLEEPTSGRARLGLLSPPVSGRLGLRLDRLIRTAPGVWAFRHSRPLWPALARVGMPTVFAPNPSHLWHKVEATRRKAQDAQRANWAGTVGGALAVVNTDYRPRLAEVRVPTLVVVGELDLTVLPEDGILTAGHISGARLALLPGVAHQVTDEAPEDIQRLLLEFLLPPQEVPDHA